MPAEAECAMRVSLVVDNLASEGLRSEHGLSFLVETDDGSVLFDTGQSDAWLRNLAALGKDPREIRAVAISHGHYDHTGGLARAIGEAPDARFFAHPACFEPKYSQFDGGTRYNGMPPDAVSLKGAFTLNTKPVELAPGVLLSGEIDFGVDSFRLESRFVTGQEKLRPDTFEDEQCLILRNGGTTAVLVGCSHRGVENNVLAAMDLAGVSRVDLLVGGFHLGEAGEERLDGLAGFLKRTDVAQIACCHCTGMGAYEYLRSELGSRVTLARTGSRWEI